MEPTQRRLLPSTSALAAFDAVARLGSMSAAATSLNLTPGAISRHVAMLEDQLGVALINRSNKGISLTDKGRRYAESAAQIIRSLRLMSLEALSDNPSGTLRLAILPTFGTRWLLPRMPEFLKSNPGITVNFATRIGRVDFDAENLDAAIHIGSPDWPGCHFQPLMRETVAPVCSPAFLAENDIREPRSLLDMPLLEMASRPNAWRHWFDSLGIDAPYREGMRFEQFMHVSQACRVGLGVALMPLFLIEAELSSGELVIASDHRAESRSAYYFVTPASRKTPPSATRFVEWLMRAISDQPA